MPGPHNTPTPHHPGSGETVTASLVSGKIPELTRLKRIRTHTPRHNLRVPTLHLLPLDHEAVGKGNINLIVFSLISFFFLSLITLRTLPRIKKRPERHSLNKSMYVHVCVTNVRLSYKVFFLYTNVQGYLLYKMFNI